MKGEERYNVGLGRIGEKPCPAKWRTTKTKKSKRQRHYDKQYSGEIEETINRHPEEQVGRKVLILKGEKSLKGV